LIQATLNRHASTVEILLKHGASPNLRSRWSNSALFWAADLQEPEIIRLLQRYGAKVLKV
jgi:GA-binding protein transcription factor beta